MTATVFYKWREWKQSKQCAGSSYVQMNILYWMIHRRYIYPLMTLANWVQSFGLLMILNEQLIDCLLTFKIEILSLCASKDLRHCLCRTSLSLNHWLVDQALQRAYHNLERSYQRQVSAQHIDDSPKILQSVVAGTEQALIVTKHLLYLCLLLLYIYVFSIVGSKNLKGG